MLARRSLLLAGASLALGCKRAPPLPASCDDTSGLTDEERAARKTLAYVDRSTTPEKECRACQHWIAPRDESACGGCKLLKGPIHPIGSCKAFALKS